MIPLKSEITKKLLSYFFINPDDSLYVNELARKLAVDKRNLVKKVRQLEAEGILKSQARGNLKFYSVNRAFPLYKEYRQLFLKSVGFEDKLKRTLGKVAGVNQVYIYGSYALGKMSSSSDIDVLIVGTHAIADAQKGINRLQKEIGREINAVHMGLNEFKRKLRKKEPFVSGIVGDKHIQVI